MQQRCNPDYHGPMLCRRVYAGTEWPKSACTKFGGIHICLQDIKTHVKRDWLLVDSRQEG